MPHQSIHRSGSADLMNPIALMADTIRGLTMDAVREAGSGHAGTPMGCAEIGAYLYGSFLKHHPLNPQWENRDRFILSAGHASMLQYACLHLTGYPLSLEDLKRFRQLDSLTPSHPQYGITAGVETTTGLDGQGIAHGVGQALGLKILAERFNRETCLIYDAKVVVLAGDGCFMEGICHESCALAGHLNLNNLILIYDRNKTCLDGYVSESCSEDTAKRFEAYGWDTAIVDGHDIEALDTILSPLREHQPRPFLLIADTIIGKGAPTLAGSYLIHNDPLQEKEEREAKQRLGLSSEPFHVPEQLKIHFTEKLAATTSMVEAWQELVERWKAHYPELDAEHAAMRPAFVPSGLETKLLSLPLPSLISGRRASHYVVNFLADELPGLYGGSADLSRSDMTHLDDQGVISPNMFHGRNIKYGVREFAMSTLAIGLAQTQKITPFIGTFLAFSDYMLSAIRMAALMRLPLIYQFTHDSIFIGQDGPTHQPIEQLAHLRGIPHLQVIRPADGNEVKHAWLAALRYKGPTALIFSRQELPSCSGTDRPFEEGVGRGAYLLKDTLKPAFTLLATGSEVFLALQVAERLEAEGHPVRVLSFPCWQLFDAQPASYQMTLLNGHSGKRVSIEAGCALGWHKYVLDGMIISVDTYGKSAHAADLAEEFGFTVNQIIHQLSMEPTSKVEMPALLKPNF